MHITRRSFIHTAAPRAFTLIELLVVVAIIALLISILLPSLSRARESARTVACSSIMRQFGLANHMYADAENNYFVPIRIAGAGVEGGTWAWNPAFRSMLGLPPLIPEDLNHGDGFAHGGYPTGFVCPSTTAERKEIGDVIHSYGMNIANHPSRRDWIPVSGMYVYHRPTIQSPSQKFLMMDANEWRMNLSNTDYNTNWDRFGESRSITGGRNSVAYRHSDGVNLQHFDGHVEYYTKQEAWTEDMDRNYKFWRVLQP